MANASDNGSITKAKRISTHLERILEEKPTVQDVSTQETQIHIDIKDDSITSSQRLKIESAIMNVIDDTVFDTAGWEGTGGFHGPNERARLTIRPSSS